MASPRTRRVLAELRPKSENNVSMDGGFENSRSLYTFSVEMLRVWDSQPPVGECYIRYLDMLRVLWKTSGVGGPPVLCEVRHHGQVEGHRAQQDEGGRKQERKGLLCQPERLE